MGPKGGENEQPGSPSQAPVKTQRAGACLQAVCSLPLAPVSCRRSLSVEAIPPLQLACRTRGPENTPLPPALCWVTSPSGTLVAGTHPTSSCTQKCYAHWNGGIVAGISIPFRACVHRLFSSLGGFGNHCYDGYFGFPASFFGGNACGTLPASARVFADWVESCPEGSLNPTR